MIIGGVASYIGVGKIASGEAVMYRKLEICSFQRELMGSQVV